MVPTFSRCCFLGFHPRWVPHSLDSVFLDPTFPEFLLPWFLPFQVPLSVGLPSSESPICPVAL